jgi:hypothetical protein
MTASQTLAQSLSASPSVTSYPTTLFSLPPPYHYEVTDLSSYTLYLFLYDKVLRRPVELAVQKRTNRPGPKSSVVRYCPRLCENASLDLILGIRFSRDLREDQMKRHAAHFHDHFGYASHFWRLAGVCEGSCLRLLSHFRLA